MRTATYREKFCKDCERVTVQQAVGVVAPESILSRQAWWCVDGNHQVVLPNGKPPSRES